MAMTSLILIGSFASMGFSDFLPTSHFGLLSSLTIALALVADLTLLPVLLSRCQSIAGKSYADVGFTNAADAESKLTARSAWARQS
jgi:hypothetical protein